MTDRTPSVAKQAYELKARRNVKSAAAPESLQDQVNQAFSQGRGASSGLGGAGAADAAGVLTAVDEDGEGEEEAPVPDDFEYDTDADDE